MQTPRWTVLPSSVKASGVALRHGSWLSESIGPRRTLFSYWPCRCVISNNLRARLIGSVPFIEPRHWSPLADSLISQASGEFGDDFKWGPTGTLQPEDEYMTLFRRRRQQEASAKAKELKVGSSPFARPSQREFSLSPDLTKVDFQDLDWFAWRWNSYNYNPRT